MVNSRRRVRSGKAPVKQSRRKAGESINGVSKANSSYKGQAPVRRKSNRLEKVKDPRLGSAERMRQCLRDVMKDQEKYGLPDTDLEIEERSSDDGIDWKKVQANIKSLQLRHGTSGDLLERYEAELKYHEENEEEILAEIDYNVALVAVKFYNDKHSTNYVVEETLGSYSDEFDDGYWTHCNFRAKNTAAGRRPVSRLFFAELLGYDVDDYEVDSCVTLDGPGRCCDIVRGCEMCPKLIRHPVNGFKNGLPDEYTFV